MSIIVTGGAGFIGSNFVLDWLGQSDEAVINIDKLTYAGNFENLKTLQGDPQHIFIQGGIDGTSLLSALQAEHKPRAIINFAAESHVDRSAHGPQMLATTTVCMAQSRSAKGKGFKQLELNPDTFGNVPAESIDYAVMEKSDRVAVVPCNIGWSDIGSWTALGDLTAPDIDGNRIQGNALLHNTRNCTIQSNDRLVGTVGVENLIIIDTPNALLVADKSCAQDVKHIYAELKAKGHEAHELHRTVHRPWGTYTELGEGSGFKIKRIEVKPGASLSLQMHHHRSEHWVVVSGQARVINGTKDILINTNESTYIPAGHQHRLTNPGDILCVMIEVQSGSYLGEDDIVRFEDTYGRVAAQPVEV
jgi:mannose-1-phosphate guanylyltransferase